MVGVLPGGIHTSLAEWFPRVGIVAAEGIEGMPIDRRIV
jgi:hypothetical protein